MRYLLTSALDLSLSFDVMKGARNAIYAEPTVRIHDHCRNLASDELPTQPGRSSLGTSSHRGGRQ